MIAPARRDVLGYVESFHRPGRLIEVYEGDHIVHMDALDGSGQEGYLIRAEMFDVALCARRFTERFFKGTAG